MDSNIFRELCELQLTDLSYSDASRGSIKLLSLKEVSKRFSVEKDIVV